MSDHRIITVYGKHASPVGNTPAVCLINPKYLRNVSRAIRSASCYNVSQVWYTGDRIQLEDQKRLPREERMKGYKDVTLIQYDYPFDAFPDDTVPVAVELAKGSECLHDFIHPDNALYVFGPEDGSINGAVKRHCHRFVYIPTRHCLNLAIAVSTVLYDRANKRDERFELAESRGFIY